ncbi:DUF1396 domain-containing protein [Streptomyces physcomitrii]
MASAMRAVRKKAGVALVAAALVCGAAACSSSSEGGDKAGGGEQRAEQTPAMRPAAAVRKAAERSERLTSFHYRAKGTVPGQGKVEAEAGMSIEPLAMSLKSTVTGGADAGEAEIRLIDEVLYIGMGKPQPEMDGKSWMKFGGKGLGGAKGPRGGGLSSQAQKNPAAESTFLTGSKDVKLVGTETVEGVRTRHYRGTVSLDELRASLTGSDGKRREQREKSLEQYEELGIGTLDMDLWIDGDDRTKQFRMRGKAEEGPMDMTLTFLDFNKPVEVKAPPAAEVFDFAKEMAALAEE